jgi:hypothetical protein
LHLRLHPAAGKLFEYPLTSASTESDKLKEVGELGELTKKDLDRLNEREKRELVKKFVEELKQTRFSPCYPGRVSDQERELIYSVWMLDGRWPLWELGYSSNTIFKHVAKAHIAKVDGWLDNFLKKGRHHPRRSHLKGKVDQSR